MSGPSPDPKRAQFGGAPPPPQLATSLSQGMTMQPQQPQPMPVNNLQTMKGMGPQMPQNMTPQLQEMIMRLLGSQMR